MNAEPARHATARIVRGILNCQPTTAKGASQYGESPAPIKMSGSAQHADNAKAEAIPPTTRAIAPFDLSADFIACAYR